MPSPSYPSTSSPPRVSKIGVRVQSVPLSARVTPDCSADKSRAPPRRETRHARPPPPSNRFGLQDSDTSGASSGGELRESDSDDGDTPVRPKKHLPGVVGADPVGSHHSATSKRRISRRWSVDPENRYGSPLPSSAACVPVLLTRSGHPDMAI